MSICHHAFFHGNYAKITMQNDNKLYSRQWPGLCTVLKITISKDSELKNYLVQISLYNSLITFESWILELSNSILFWAFSMVGHEDLSDYIYSWGTPTKKILRCVVLKE